MRVCPRECAVVPAQTHHLDGSQSPTRSERAELLRGIVRVRDQTGDVDVTVDGRDVACALEATEERVEQRGVLFACSGTPQSDRFYHLGEVTLEEAHAPGLQQHQLVHLWLCLKKNSASLNN